MDFFGRQDAARRKTTRLVFLYVIAVAMIITAVYFAFSVSFIGVRSKGGRWDWDKLWDAELFAWVAGSTLLVVVLGTWYKMSQLRQGGRAVATQLGGRLVQRSTRDPVERKLLNVVEEMAIASGTAVPAVYLLDKESGINAFAAGLTTSDAVVAVTRGCATRLSRDELQGVVAHEFSHILNGAMRLNMRLMGVLNGILVLGILGYVVLRVAPYLMRSSGRGSSRGKGAALGVALAIALFGLILMVIGYVGVFFSKLIKSAVSRQREYRPDASAVQFTRQPLGRAGALKKIGGMHSGSRIRSPRAQEASHLFFANGLGSAMIGLMATHPPLLDRVRRIEPGFDGNFARFAPTPVEAERARVDKKAKAKAAMSPLGILTGQTVMPSRGGLAGPATAAVVLDALRYRARAAEVIASVGAPGPEHVKRAGELVAGIPGRLARAVEDPRGAMAAVYCLMLNKEAEPRRKQIARLEQHATEPVRRETLALAPAAERMSLEARLPLVDLAIASLRELSRKQFDEFAANVRHLIAADERVDLFEFVLSRVILRHLAPAFGRAKAPAARYFSIRPLAGDCGVLLSALAHRGAHDGAVDSAEAAEVYAVGVALLGMKRAPAILPREHCGLDAVDAALGKLACASPGIKKRVLRACVACVGADDTVTIEEAELLRAVADSLGCPVPPLLPSEAEPKA